MQEIAIVKMSLNTESRALVNPYSKVYRHRYSTNRLYMAHIDIGHLKAFKGG